MANEDVNTELTMPPFEWPSDLHQTSKVERTERASDIAFTIGALTDIYSKLEIQKDSPGVKFWYNDNRASYIVAAIGQLAECQSEILSSLCDTYSKEVNHETA